MNRKIVAPAAAAVVVLALAGCSPSDSVKSTDVETTTTTATTTTIDPTTTTTPSSTTTSTTSTTTSTTTTSTTTTVPASSTTIVATDPVDTPATAIAADDADLIEVEVASGATVRAITEFFNGDGVFRGELRLTNDRSTVWFSEGYEDGWYDCDSSIGSFGNVRLEDGAVEIIGQGVGPEPSADGMFVAYITTEVCVPDPEAPDLWVLTPYDRVVVRQLETGDEREFVSNQTPDDYNSPGAIQWAGFSSSGTLLVMTNDGQLRNVDIDGSSVLQDHPVVMPEVVGFPVGATGDVLYTIDFGDEGSADLYAADPLSGAMTLLASSETYFTAGLDPVTGWVVVAGVGEIDVVPGAPVTVVPVPAELTLYDIDW